MLQRRHEPELLLHAARVLAHPLAQVAVVELERGAELVAQHGRARVQPGEGVEGAPAGEGGVEAELPGQVAHLRQRSHAVVGEVVAHHHHGSRAGTHETQREPDEGRLARPVRTEEAEALAGLHDQVDPVDSGRGGVHPCESRGLDGVVHSDEGYARAVELSLTYATPWGVGWIAPTPPKMQRASHALAQDGDVWLIDPVAGEGVTDQLEQLGTVRGVLQLLDRHPRDCAALARHYGVPHLVTPRDGVPDSPFQTIGVVDHRWWREVALWWPEQRALVVPEALGTGQRFLTTGERLGVHPGLRMFPPHVLDGYDPQRVLVGHGPPIEGDDVAGLVSHAIDTSRRTFPDCSSRHAEGVAGDGAGRHARP